MNKLLEELGIIYSGKDYKHNAKGERYPIYGTGGIIGHTSITLNEGPAILTGRKGTINKPIYVEGGFWNVDTIFCVKPKSDIDPKWLYYNFSNTDLSKLNEATGVPSVSSKALYKLNFRWVELNEQKRIAEILDSISNVIQKTRATIAKYQAIKQGMLHDLFTRGIDLKTGKLRPTYKEAPKLYKKSELGMIPKEWEENSLDSLCEVNPQSNLSAKLKNSDTVTFLKMEDVSNDAEIINYNTKAISAVFKKGFTAFIENDVLFAKITPCMENGKGALAVNLEKGIGFGSTEFHVLRAKQAESIWFLFYLTTSKPFRLKAEGKMSGSAGQQRVPTSFFHEYHLPIPPHKEQLEIGKRLNTINKKLRSEQSYLQKLQQLKSGLMNDLLSGKKKVTLKV